MRIRSKRLTRKKKRHGNFRRFDADALFRVQTSSKHVEILGVPNIVKKPHSDYTYAIHLSESKIVLFLSTLDKVKGLASKDKLPERLEFFYKDGYRRQWSLQRIIDHDYNILRSLEHV